MTMIIQAAGGKRINAACAIPYRGYIISISTIAKPAEILVFNEATREDVKKFPTTAEGIKQAFAIVDDIHSQ